MGTGLTPGAGGAPRSVSALQRRPSTPVLSASEEVGSEWVPVQPRGLGPTPAARAPVCALGFAGCSAGCMAHVRRTTRLPLWSWGPASITTSTLEHFCHLRGRPCPREWLATPCPPPQPLAPADPLSLGLPVRTLRADGARRCVTSVLGSSRWALCPQGSPTCARCAVRRCCAPSRG